jgi:hypothetical protein
MGWGQIKSDLLLEFSPLKNSKIMEEGYNPFLSLHDTSFIMSVRAQDKNETNGFYHNEHLYKFPQKHEFLASIYEENKEKFAVSCILFKENSIVNKYKIKNQKLVLVLSEEIEGSLEPTYTQSSAYNSEYTILRDYEPESCSPESNHIVILDKNLKKQMTIEPFKNSLYEFHSYKWTSPEEIILYTQNSNTNSNIKMLKINIKEKNIKELLDLTPKKGAVNSINESREKRLIIDCSNGVLIYNTNDKKIEHQLDGNIIDLLVLDTAFYILIKDFNAKVNQNILVYSCDKNGQLIKFDTGFNEIKHPYFLVQSGKDIYLRNGESFFYLKDRFKKIFSSDYEKLDLIQMSGCYDYLFIRNLTKNKIQIYKR